MANWAGKLMVISVLTGGGPTYSVLGGLRTRSFRFNGASIDVTDSESVDLFQELLDGGGVKSVEISASGLFEDDAAIAKVRTDFLVGALNTYRAVIPSFYQIEGSFFISSVEFSGNHDDAVAQSITLNSNGKPTFTAI